MNSLFWLNMNFILPHCFIFILLRVNSFSNYSFVWLFQYIGILVCGYNLSSINFLSLHLHFLPSNFFAAPRSYAECSVSLWSLGSLSRGHGTEVLVGKLILLLPVCRHPQAAVSVYLISPPFRGAAHFSSGFKQSAWLRLLLFQVLCLPTIDHAGVYWPHTIHVTQHFFQKYTVMNFSIFPFIWLIFTWVLDMPLKNTHTASPWSSCSSLKKKGVFFLNWCFTS